jgi:hypothetical protein
MRRISSLLSLPILLAACTDIQSESALGAGLGLPDDPNGNDTSAGEDDDDGETGDGSGEGDDDDGDAPPVMDVGAPDDGGGEDGDAPNTGEIPETCEDAETSETAIGCEFFAVDLDNRSDEVQYGIALSNVQRSAMAEVQVEQKIGGVWTQIDGASLAPMAVHVMELPDLAQDGPGIREDGVYRIVADVPIIAYQFNPLSQGVFTTDASMLIPIPSWDYHYTVVGWETTLQSQPAYFTVAAAKDGTLVEITATEHLLGGGPVVPSVAPGETVTIALNEGDVLEYTTMYTETSLNGTKIRSDADHPIAVFSGHECANIPHGMGFCDHLEEQLFGSQMWGRRYMAARVPVRDTFGNPEESLWHITARNDGTVVHFDAHPDVTGVPANATLDAGETLELWVTGTVDHPGDFQVTANLPIAVMNYMTGSTNLDSFQPGYGDPAAVQAAPMEQYLPRYAVLVPNGFTYDYAVLTREPGEEIRVDGVPVPEAIFEAVGDREVGRHLMEDGVHILESDAPFGLQIVGYYEMDSYAYLGGLALAPINPIPEG